MVQISKTQAIHEKNYNNSKTISIFQQLQI